MLTLQQIAGGPHPEERAGVLCILLSCAVYVHLTLSETQQVRSLRVKEQEVFLDSDNLTDLRQLLVHIADSDCIALLHTAVRCSFFVTFHRPVLQSCWCSTNI